MANLTTKSFATLVQDQAAAIQARATALVDFGVGAIMLAAVEANAAVSLWLQGLILKLLTVTRAATSVGTDLDTWVADFGLTRMPGVAATGFVSYARQSVGVQALVPVGAELQTADGSVNFVVVASPGDPNYSAILGGYVIPIGIPVIAVPVRAAAIGVSGNVVARSITVSRTAISGVDTVYNLAKFTTGLNAESDIALRLRFIAFILSLREATAQAVLYAISTVQQGLTSVIIQNENFDGSRNLGYFTVVLNDGSGAPPQSLLDTVYLAIDPIRPLCVSFGVFAPQITTVDLSMDVTVAEGFDQPTVLGQVFAALVAYINSMGIGQRLSYARLAQVAFNASPGVIDVQNYTLAGGTADVVLNNRHIARAGTIAVN